MRSSDITNGQPITDPFNQCGFPGFDGMFAKNTLGEVAQMQEAGVPVTFGYISDAHDGHGVAGEIHHAYGPGEAGLRPAAEGLRRGVRATSSPACRTTGSRRTTRSSSSPSRRATTSPAPRRTTRRATASRKACTYATHVSEVNGDLKRLVATYNANHGTTATTDFSVHSDLAPNVYITGNPARDTATARDLEKAMSDITVTNPYSHQQQNLFVAMADPVEEKLLHMVTADPAADADVHAVRAGRLLPQRVVDDAVPGQRPERVPH